VEAGIPRASDETDDDARRQDRALSA
jgi:hypothetical protein